MLSIMWIMKRLILQCSRIEIHFIKRTIRNLPEMRLKRVSKRVYRRKMRVAFKRKL